MERQVGMAYAKEEPKISMPIEARGGLEVSLPRRVREGEYVSSWFGAPIGKDMYVWIESGLEDELDGAFVRLTLYASPSFWIEHGIELALGNEKLLASL